MNRSSPREEIAVLEPATPYDRSMKWDIQTRYYQGRGKAAWITGEVPYYVTSNGAAARQQGIVLYEAVRAMQRAGTLAPTDPIYVLELASGVGLFALNCLVTFRALDLEQGESFASRIKYIFTDFSENNLRDAASNPHVQAAIAEGRLELCVVDALAPSTMRPLAEGEAVPVPKLTAIIANYLHCCLPVRLFRRSPTGLEERYVTLLLRIPAYVHGEDRNPERLIEHPELGGLDNLIEDLTWVYTDDEHAFDEPLHAELSRQLTAGFEVASIPYPRGSLQNLREVLPLLHEGGIALISDKGFVERTYMEGQVEFRPSVHGNSFAHSLNFPFLAAYARSLGHSVMLTAHEAFGIQTLLVEKRGTPALARVFREQLIESNINLDSLDFLQEGSRQFKQKEYDVALRFFLRALALCRFDGPLLHNIGACLYHTGEYETALTYLYRGRPLNFFASADFELAIGQCLAKLGREEEAATEFMRSLEAKPNPSAWHGLGTCQYRLGDARAAVHSYRKALELDAKHEGALRELEALGL